MNNISEEMQGKIMQFQQIQQQIQMIAQQKYQIDMQVTEIEKTMEELANLKKDAEIYKSVGTLLVRNDDKEELTKELEEGDPGDKNQDTGQPGKDTEGDAPEPAAGAYPGPSTGEGMSRHPGKGIILNCIKPVRS